MIFRDENKVSIRIQAPYGRTYTDKPAPGLAATVQGPRVAVVTRRWTETTLTAGRQGSGLEAEKFTFTTASRIGGSVHTRPQITLHAGTDSERFQGPAQGAGILAQVSWTLILILVQPPRTLNTT